MRLILLFLFSCSLFLINIQAKPLPLTDNSKKELAPFLEEYTGTDEAFATMEKSGKFRPVQSELYFGPKPGKKQWYRFRLKNSTINTEWILSFPNFRLDLIELMIPENGSYVIKIKGDSIPVSRWNDPELYYALRIPMPANGEKTFFLAIENKTFNLTRAILSDPVTFTREQTRLNLLLTFLFSATLVFIIYNLNLYRIHRNTVYLYILPVGAMFFLFNFMIQGETYYLWPDWPRFQDRSLLNAGFFLTITIYIFLRKFLQLKERQPLMDRAFKIFIILNIAFLLSYDFYPGNLVYSISQLDGLVTLVLTLTATLRSRRFGFRINNLLLFYLLIAITISYRGLVLLKLIPYSVWFDWGIYAQLPLALFFFSRLLLDNLAKSTERYMDMERKYHNLKSRLGKDINREKPNRVQGIDVDLTMQKINQLIATPAIYEFDFDLTGMAAQLEIRPDQLSHILNTRVNLSFNVFLNTLRIHHSCELMRQFPDKNISHIMMESGYSSKTTYNKAFVRVMDMTPSEYRRTIQEKSVHSSDS